MYSSLSNSLSISLTHSLKPTYSNSNIHILTKNTHIYPTYALSLTHTHIHTHTHTHTHTHIHTHTHTHTLKCTKTNKYANTL